MLIFLRIIAEIEEIMQKKFQTRVKDKINLAPIACT
jgi:hypothetical protein